jgi:EmrB/QacA subfamily drug resistance transporter
VSESSAAIHTAPHRGARRKAHPAIILLIIAGAQVMVVLDATIVNVALPTMANYFNKSQTDMTWALNAYTLAFGGFLLLGGRAGDILGRRRMFAIGLVLFTVGSFLAGLATSYAFLLVGRVVQGLGGAIAAPTGLSLITTEFEEGPARNRAIGVYAAVSGAGAALGLMLGGILTEFLSWRWIFFVNVPIGIVLVTAALLYLHQSERLQGRFDFIGGALSVASMVSLVYGFIHVAHDGWANTQTYLIFTLAIVLLVGFVLFEAFVAREPMMPMRIFENRNRSGSYLIMLIIGAGMFASFYFATYFVQRVMDFSPLQTGFAFLPIAVSIGITSQLVGTLVLPRYGPKASLMCGAAILIFALWWLSTMDITATYLRPFLPAICVLGVAMGLQFVPLTLTAVSKVRNTDAGLASALLNVGQQIGGSIGLAALTTVFSTASHNYVNGNKQQLASEVVKLGPDLAPAVGKELANAGSAGLQEQDIHAFVASLPQAQQAQATEFFKGPYNEFTQQTLVHGTSAAFLGAAAFAVVALIVATFMINAKKTDAAPAEGAAPAGVH